MAANESTDDFEYYGYRIRQNSANGRWEIFWRERKLQDFARKFEAEEWIDEQIPLNR